MILLAETEIFPLQRNRNFFQLAGIHDGPGLKQHERANPGWPTRVAQFGQTAPLSGPGEKVCFPTGHDALG